MLSKLDKDLELKSETEPRKWTGTVTTIIEINLRQQAAPSGFHQPWIRGGKITRIIKNIQKHPESALFWVAMNINVHFGYDMANIQMPLDPNNGLQVVAYNHVELLDKPR